MRTALCLNMVLFAAALVACRSEVAPERLQTAESAYDEGLAAYQAKDYPVAAEKLGIALDGALRADLVIEAFPAYVRSLARTGAVAEAKKALEEFEQGSESPAQLLVLRSEIALAEGHKAEAQKFYDDARKSEPGFAKPEGL